MVRAFLLGAGATLADCPQAFVDNDFFLKLAKERQDLYRELDQNLPEKTKNSKELYRCGLEEILEGIDDLPGPMVGHFKKTVYKGIYHLLAGSTQSDLGFHRTFTNLEKPRLHESLVENSSKDDFFITLNYDLVLDMAVWERRASVPRRSSQIDYGFSSPIGTFDIEAPEKVKGDLVITDDRIRSVYHVHGALNWLPVDNEHIHVYQNALNPMITHLGLSPLIIPPGRVKEYPRVIKSVWERVRERLNGANELVIIGCSLNEHDKNLCDMIKSWREKSIEAKVKVISYVEPTTASPSKSSSRVTTKVDEREKRRMHYTHILGDKNIDFRMDGFTTDTLPWIFD